MTDDNIEVDELKVIEAIQIIMESLQEANIDEMTGYMAMTGITKAMEKTLGFSHSRKTDS